MMKISTRGRYAIRFMQDLASQPEAGYCTLKSIAERQEISPKYLEQIAKSLARAGVLETSHGRGGGYRIHGCAADYTVYDILTIVEGSLRPVACLDAPENPCPRRDFCATLTLWTGLDGVIREYLQRYTIQDLVWQ